MKTKGGKRNLLANAMIHQGSHGLSQQASWPSLVGAEAGLGLLRLSGSTQVQDHARRISCPFGLLAMHTRFCKAVMRTCSFQLSLYVVAAMLRCTDGPDRPQLLAWLARTYSCVCCFQHSISKGFCFDRFFLEQSHRHHDFDFS